MKARKKVIKPEPVMAVSKEALGFAVNHALRIIIADFKAHEAWCKRNRFGKYAQKST